jgi:hypothetical protein
MPRKRTPLTRFQAHRQRARRRGIEWCLTFDEWWTIWESSGKWDLRGAKAGHYVMARLGPDIGPYAVNNVKIQLSSENTSDGTLGKKRTLEQNAARSEFMKGNNHTTGRRWVSKDGQTLFVFQHEFDTLIAQGWTSNRGNYKR